LRTNLVNNFIVNPDVQIKLSNWDSDFTGGMYKNYAESILDNDFVNQMSNLQYKLFADKNQALLVVLQGVDASGKDSTIRHAMMLSIPRVVKLSHLRNLMMRKYPMITCGEYTNTLLQKEKLRYLIDPIMKLL
jgi:polyphosphate kinase 2 (PPK2 family)